MSHTSYNTNHQSVKRILRELKEFQEEEDPDVVAWPLEDDIFEWHFTMRGPPDSCFENGIYHGRVLLPMEYPLKPPDIIVLTPSGRFIPGKKICLSNSSYHPEDWQPAWSIRTALIALRGFMPSDPKGAVGSMNASPLKRKQLARESLNWACRSCKKKNCEIITPLKVIEIPNDDNNESEEISLENTDDNLSESVSIEELNENKEEEEKEKEENQLPNIQEVPPSPIVRRRREPEVQQPQIPQAQPGQIQYNANVHHPVQGRPHVIRRQEIRVNVVRVSPLKVNAILFVLFCILIYLLARKYF